MISSIANKNDSKVFVFDGVDDVTAESYAKTITRALREIFQDEDENQVGPYSMEELTLKYASATREARKVSKVISTKPLSLQLHYIKIALLHQHHQLRSCRKSIHIFMLHPWP